MTNPTHIHKATGALVFSGGYKRSEISPLPDDYWRNAQLASVRERASTLTKVSATEQIVNIAPLWKQANDAFDQGNPEVIKRQRRIRWVRDWSNEVEELINAATSIVEIERILLTKGVI